MRVLGIAVVFVTSVGMGGCGDNRAEACAASGPQPACDAAPDLNGIASVTEVRVIGPAPKLESQVLLDGRYVLTAETKYCSEDFTPVSQATSLQAVIEISGCVMRVNAEVAGVPQNIPSAFTFGYAGEGVLNLSVVCPPPTRTGGKSYGFDGTTLQLVDTSDESDIDGHSHTCELIDSYERR